MGIGKISFGWYLRRASWLALLGYFAGAAVHLAQDKWLNSEFFSAPTIRLARLP